jgi:hypothetical protein
MNTLPNGTIAVGAPGSNARLAAELEDAAKAKPVTYPQCTELRCKRGMQFFNLNTRRTNTIKEGAEYWVASTETAQRAGTVQICRKGQPMGAGIYMHLHELTTWFDIIG